MCPNCVFGRRKIIEEYIAEREGEEVQVFKIRCIDCGDIEEIIFY